MLTVGAVRETERGERRVALDPEAATRLVTAGHVVLVESEAGVAAGFPDSVYTDAGATVVPRAELLARSDVVLCVHAPPVEVTTAMRHGQVLIGLLRPLGDPRFAQACAAAGVTAVSLDGLPRTVSRAQSMDALSSQANITGYRAALLAAATYERYFPLFITAAGTARPARVLILGVGVAGLQAIGTARRLGAVVSAYDVRPQTRGEVESLGATFLTLESVASAVGEGGYARALTPAEQQAQQAELDDHIARHDVVITTAQVPGRRPPLLVTGAAVGRMASGSVIVDTAASPLGGNVELSVAGETTVTDNHVTIIGADNLPATMPAAASAAYARNITSLLAHLVDDGALVIDRTDEIQAGVVITHDGTVVHPATAGLLQTSTTTSTGGGARP